MGRTGSQPEQGVWNEEFWGGLGLRVCPSRLGLHPTSFCPLYVSPCPASPSSGEESRLKSFSNGFFQQNLVFQPQSSPEGQHMTLIKGVLINISFQAQGADRSLV